MLEKLREGYDKRAVGYYFTAGVTVLSLVLAIVYAIGYAGTDYISWMAVVLLGVLVVANALLLLFNKIDWIPLVSIVLSVVATCFFVYGIYFYVSVVFVGIDIQNFDARFVINTVLFVLLLGLSSANLFLKQSK